MKNKVTIYDVKNKVIIDTYLQDESEQIPEANNIIKICDVDYKVINVYSLQETGRCKAYFNIGVSENII